MKILLVDNYDSFTYNLFQLLKAEKADVDVVRNDQIDFDSLMKYDAFVLSPGPGVPDDAGDLKKLIQYVLPTKPILGICLGMQAIGEVSGSRLKLLKNPIHGKATEMTHKGGELFDQIPLTFRAGRYHSWALEQDETNPRIQVLSTDNEGEIMAIQLKGQPVYGLQFHPESILTQYGGQLIANFLKHVQ